MTTSLRCPPPKHPQGLLLEAGDRESWLLTDDQELLHMALPRWVLTALPDSFNYKPYW